MDIISNFGLEYETEQEFLELLDLVFEAGKSIKTSEGNYLSYYDSSGLEIWVQGTKSYDVLDVAAKYNGKSSRSVCLTKMVVPEGNPMNAHFHGWAEPSEIGNPESGIYPFLFDIPDFRMRPDVDLPNNYEVQLTAAPEWIDYYETAETFKKQQEAQGQALSLPSFIPIGLFEDEDSGGELQPVAMFTGSVSESKNLTNKLTGQPYYWILVDTLGGPVDVVTQPSFFDSLPQPEGIIHGTFWLSGKIL